jgi:predicted permease
VLVVSEVALSVILLVGAGLLLRTSANLRRVDIGFPPKNLTTFELSLPSSRYGNPQQTAAAFTGMVDEIRRLPGVSNAGATSALPLGGGGFYLGKSFLRGGQPIAPNGSDIPGGWDVVQPGYFEALGVRRLSGRFFDDRDSHSGKPVIILSESLAKDLFGNQNPIGERVRASRDENVDREVVGVVADVPYFSLTEAKSPVAYVPHTQETWNTMMVTVRTRNIAQGLLPAIRAAVASQDKHIAIAEVKTMDEVLSKALARPRFVMFLLLMFAGVAVLLAGVGIYGLLSYAVSQQAREIGIRLALGAQTGNVLRMVARRGMVLTFCGIGIGTACAAMLMRLIAGLLFGVTARDPTTFALTALFLTVISLGACLVPARQATRIDPIETLRYQ